MLKKNDYYFVDNTVVFYLPGSIITIELQPVLLGLIYRLEAYQLGQFGFTARSFIQYHILLYWKRFYTFTYLFNWCKLTFRGRGYRIRKFRETPKLTLHFGHSHWSKLWFKGNLWAFRIHRQNYLCIYYGWSLSWNFTRSVMGIKKTNVYTKRGLRLKRQIIERRFGKISQAISILHKM